MFEVEAIASLEVRRAASSVSLLMSLDSNTASSHHELNQIIALQYKTEKSTQNSILGIV